MLDQWKQRRESLREEDWIIGQALRDLGRAALESIPAESLTADQAMKLIELGAALQRLAVGEPTERVSVHITTGLDNLLNRVYGADPDPAGGDLQAQGGDRG